MPQQQKKKITDSQKLKACKDLVATKARLDEITKATGINVSMSSAKLDSALEAFLR